MLNVNDFQTPWDFKALSPANRKAYETQLLALEKKAFDARQVCNFITSEEYWLSTDSPKRNIMDSIYLEQVATGVLMPRPEVTPAPAP